MRNDPASPVGDQHGRAELKFGDDPDMNAMAQAIIDVQTAEIQQLATWIDEHAQ